MFRVNAKYNILLEKKKINENTYFYLEQNMANMNNKSVNCILKYPFLKNLNGQSL